jgi:ribosome maturation factor RimP
MMNPKETNILRLREKQLSLRQLLIVTSKRGPKVPSSVLPGGPKHVSMALNEEIKALTERHLASPEHFVVDVVVSERGGPRKVIVMVDGDQGITIDQCGDLNRALSEELDRTDWFKDSYMLEVGTPGLDHPLKLKRQYRKNTGRQLKVVKSDGSVVKGRLKSVEEDGIVMEVGEESASVGFSEIRKAFVQVSFK